MTIRNIYRSIIEAKELPQVVQLEDSLYGAAFGLMKLLPAHHMLDRAKEQKFLDQSTTVVESTSGTFGLALAMLCAIDKRPLVLVSDPAIDAAFRLRLEDLGATVDIVRKPEAVGGYQAARLARLREHQHRVSNHYWPRQYTNPDNVGAYSKVAEILVESLGEIDCLVGTVGSGGSVCGTSRFLRQLLPKLRVIGIDTPGSVLFGLPDAKRVLRGLGNSVHPTNLDHTAIDEVHWVDGATAFLATRLLHREAALFRGGTSGAAFLVARWWARRNPGAKTVVLLPDEGDRYLTTIYDDNWLEAEGLRRSKLPEAPVEASSLADVPANAWSRFDWRRRTFEAVTGQRYGSSELL